MAAPPTDDDRRRAVVERWFRALPEDLREVERSWLQGENREALGALGLAVSLERTSQGVPDLTATGHLQGTPVRVVRRWFTEDKAVFRTTEVSATLSPAALRVLRIGLEGSVTLAVQELTGIQDLQCGSPDLDTMFRFRSPEPRLAVRMLRSVRFQSALRVALRMPGGEQVVSASEPWCRLTHPTDFSDALFGVAALARAREEALEAALDATCGVPGLERVMDRPERGFAGMLAGVRVSVDHAPAWDGVCITAQPRTPWQTGLIIRARDSPLASRWRRAPGTPVKTRDPILDSVLEVRVAEGDRLERSLAQDHLREALLVVLKGQPRAEVANGAVRVELHDLEPSVVHAAAHDAARLAAGLGDGGMRVAPLG